MVIGNKNTCTFRFTDGKFRGKWVKMVSLCLCAIVKYFSLDQEIEFQLLTTYAKAKQIRALSANVYIDIDLLTKFDWLLYKKLN